MQCGLTYQYFAMLNYHFINFTIRSISYTKEKWISNDNNTFQCKLTKQDIALQDNALRHFENAENDLPRLIAQNSEDQRVLKARLRKAKEAERALGTRE